VFGQRTTLWWDLPLRDSFDLLQKIYRTDPARHRANLAEFVELLGLGDLLLTPVRQLSLGQRMRGDIAAALLHDPEILYLDEPTIGLDVVSKGRLRDFLRTLNAERGTTLLLTTHDMGDVERLCDRILVIDRGRLAYDGDLPGLSRTVGAERVLVVDLAEPTDDLTAIPGTTHLGSEAHGLRQRLSFDADTTTVPRLLAAVAGRAEVVDLTVEEPDIEDVVRRIYAARR
jgi:ABC-2 type transport system ATP-binding protein